MGKLPGDGAESEKMNGEAVITNGRDIMKTDVTSVSAYRYYIMNLHTIFPSVYEWQQNRGFTTTFLWIVNF